MDFINLVSLRQSTRKYSPSPVNPADIEKCLETARLAPSASNSQPWKFIVVTEKELLAKVAAAAVSAGIPVNRFATRAPVIVVIVVEKPRIITRIAGKIKNKEFEWTDLGITAEHFCLQATELSLGTCMIGWFDEQRIRELLHVPESKRIGLLITLGYPAENYKVRTKFRKPLNRIYAYNRWEW